MSKNKETWEEYTKSELAVVRPLLEKNGYTLNPDQPHIKGERFLMQAMTTAGGKKLILIGKKEGATVVIKVTKNQAGKDELLHERLCRQTLHNIDFAYDSFYSPQEIEFFNAEGYVVSVQEFISQASTFLERPLVEQFNFALKALKTQEGARATTKKHFDKVARVFGNRNVTDYLRLHSGFLTFLKKESAAESVIANVTKADEKLVMARERIEQYCGFLTHTDFVPHNFRIKDDTLYLLDFSSLQFGNKHESWARFLNFMTLYNHDLEKALIKFMGDNRSKEERESLQLMRLFRLGEIIAYYVDKSNKSNDNLKKLNQARVQFWNEVLSAELRNERVSREIVEEYKRSRDSLRSQEEKERQVGLH